MTVRVPYMGIALLVCASMACASGARPADRRLGGPVTPSPTPLPLVEAREPPEEVPRARLDGAPGTVLSTSWLVGSTMVVSEPAAQGVRWPAPTRLAASARLLLGTDVAPSRVRVTWFRDAGANAEPGDELASGECSAAEASTTCTISASLGDDVVVTVTRPGNVAGTVIAVVTAAWYIPRSLHDRVKINTAEMRAAWGWRLRAS